MSFTVGSLSTSTSLAFKPTRLDIQWDGVSNGKVSVLPVCSSTASTATYTVRALHVFPAAVTKTLYASGVTSSYSASAGEPFRNNHTSNAQVATPFVVGSTLNTASGEVSFELMPSNTNYTAAMDFGTYRTSQASSYQWSVEQARGTSVQLVAVGQLNRTPPNAFSADTGYGTLVQGQTAFFCIG
jgi:hypothetical protein